VNLQDFPKAIDCYHQSIAYAEKIGDKGLLAYNYSLLGSVLLSQGKSTDTVILYQEKALKSFKEVNVPNGIIGTSVSLAQSYTRHGSYQKAYHLMTDVFRAGQIYQIPSYLAPAYGIYADLLLNAKDEVPEINTIKNR